MEVAMRLTRWAAGWDASDILGNSDYNLGGTNGSGSERRGKIGLRIGVHSGPITAGKL